MLSAKVGISTADPAAHGHQTPQQEDGEHSWHEIPGTEYDFLRQAWNERFPHQARCEIAEEVLDKHRPETNYHDIGGRCTDDN